jgi:hypothetical protein
MFLDELFQPVSKNVRVNLGIPISKNHYSTRMEQVYTRKSNFGPPMQLLAGVESCLVDLFQL